MQQAEVGERGAEEAEARAGLTERGLVVRVPSDRLEDGVRVRAR